ncbi:hypothetical protein K437DRAFT_253119 [Tilletiaria anomala UBC 951]|uniref:THIF-type NAD/FAD binding fold domain-containing protein n=1 Tax=Tilletiaria anomala (strain ATCC 24038 / CBS 436.72 / UBC 951) TaxID=1037660 RepID=A0A066WHZ5_TILAU|nr:uncharacterized protein K437DRAFT_253119 [Tilletiaria anomala UBC 951]KDN53421.1 hypothetical protein K437DRAFT_253119 [Tilletiaria anomala UBC 951]
MDPSSISTSSASYPLTLPEYTRYGRQMILPDFGLQAQLRLKNARVLVVGAGGLGCPAIQYLAAAGVGNITIIDHDVVERSNLARQILHSDARIGQPKASSASLSALQINPHINVDPLVEPLSPANALQLVQGHDIVLDCTDNPLTRYLLNDAAVLADRMLVSAAAQGYEGQLGVWNRWLDPREEVVPSHQLADKGKAGEPSLEEQRTGGASTRSRRLTHPRGPCYRCIFPVAPSPQHVTDCADSGVLGVITGLVGTLQATEAVRLIARIGDEFSEDALEHAANAERETAQACTETPLGRKAAPAGVMTLISPITSPMQPFRTIKLRPRRLGTCRACGDPLLVRAHLHKKAGAEGAEEASEPGQEVSSMIEDLQSEDYVSFCGLKAAPGADRAQCDVNGGQRLEPIVLKRVAIRAEENEPGAGGITIDVRPAVEYGIVQLGDTCNMPIDRIRRAPSAALADIHNLVASGSHAHSAVPVQIRLLCRRGNDSLEAARLLRREETIRQGHKGGEGPQARERVKLDFVDVRGGLTAYSHDVDAQFPVY